MQECLKRGEEWDPVEFARLKEEARQKELEEEELSRKRKKEKFVPKANYQEKYEHLIGECIGHWSTNTQLNVYSDLLHGGFLGKESALEAARKTELNKSYGMVSAESKKDRRTVEDIQKEIREKKRQKLMAQEEDEEEEEEKS